MKLRDYQARAVRELPLLLKKHRRVVAVAPTSSGKTVIGAALLREMRSKRVLWIAHRLELVQQAYDQLRAAGVPEKDLGMLTGSDKVNPSARVLVASVAMFRGDALVPEADLIVIDEAHHVAAESYLYIMRVRPRALVLGLTATPWRLDGEPLGEVFAYLHVVAETIELVAEGHVMQSQVYACIDHATSKAVTRGLTTSGGDWSRKKLEGRMRTAKLMGDVVKEWKRRAENQPTLLFATTVDHATDMSGRFRRAGVTSEVVSWETPVTERRAILERLRTGSTLVVCNVAVFTEGLDCPPVKCIIMVRPTKSLTLYRQMCGRGGRPHGRRRPVILDHAGNVWRHGLPESPIPWSLAAEVSADGVAPTKTCAACELQIPLGSKSCPECGAEQTIEIVDSEDALARLARIRASEEQKRETLALLAEIAKKKHADTRWVDLVAAKLFGAT